MAKNKCVTPCKECPWRRKAMPGWLGSQYSRQSWLDQANSDMMVPCHLTLGDGKTPLQCSGMATYRENICKVPRGDDPGAIVNAAPDKKNVFALPMEFMEHHGKLGVISSEMKENSK